MCLSNSVMLRLDPFIIGLRKDKKKNCIMERNLISNRILFNLPTINTIVFKLIMLHGLMTKCYRFLTNSKITILIS